MSNATDPIHTCGWPASAHDTVGNCPRTLAQYEAERTDGRNAVTIATPLDPIDPTLVTPELVAIPLHPTVWDDAEDGQHAVTPDGVVWQRRNGLWHMDPWWQGSDDEEIVAVCADPDEYAYDLGWNRAQVEDAKGSLTLITLPLGSSFPHDDKKCRNASVDSDGFLAACREVGRLAEALGIDSPQGIAEVVDAAIRRIEADRG